MNAAMALFAMLAAVATIMERPSHVGPPTRSNIAECIWPYANGPSAGIIYGLREEMAEKARRGLWRQPCLWSHWAVAEKPDRYVPIDENETDIVK